MWLYCPKCNKQKNVEDYSLYYVCRCDACGHKFRGIHAKMNAGWHTLLRVLTPKADNPAATACIYCGNNVYNATDGVPGDGGWPEVCGSCCRELPTQPANQNDRAVL